MKIDLSFFEQDTLAVAEQIIGCYLVRRIKDREIIIRITETEAYTGAEDPASHAHRGMTARNSPMFGRAGRLYVYLSYGLHHCMNIVTEKDKIPGAVLLRAGEPIQGTGLIREFRPNIADKDLLNGPGKLAKGMAVDLDFNGYDLLDETDSQLTVHPRDKSYSVTRTGRVGISKAREYPWRFFTRER